MSGNLSRIRCQITSGSSTTINFGVWGSNGIVRFAKASVYRLFREVIKYRLDFALWVLSKVWIFR